MSYSGEKDCSLNLQESYSCDYCGKRQLVYNDGHVIESHAGSCGAIRKLAARIEILEKRLENA